MIVNAIKTRIFKEKESISEFILEYIKRNIGRLKEGDVFVVTSKIVALSEGRTVDYISREHKIEIVQKESQKSVVTPWCILACKDGEWCASAGVDESNAQDRLILLPKNSFAAARKIRAVLQKRFKIKKLGVILTDSRSLPLKSGVIGVAVGYAGIEPRRSYIGKTDIFGRELKFTRSNVIDSLAASAVLMMGEASEQRPLALIRDAGVEFTNKKYKMSDMIIAPQDDMYSYAYKAHQKRYNKNK